LEQFWRGSYAKGLIIVRQSSQDGDFLEIYQEARIKALTPENIQEA
jgi:hypothetical protein